MKLGADLDHSPLSEHRNVLGRRQRGPAAELVGPPAGHRARLRCVMRARRAIGSGGRGRWERIPAKVNGAESSEGIRGAPAAGVGRRGVSWYSGRLWLMTGVTPREGDGSTVPGAGHRCTLLWEATQGPPTAAGSGSAAGARRAQQSLGSEGNREPSPALGSRRPTDRPMRLTTRLHTEDLIFVF